MSVGFLSSFQWAWGNLLSNTDLTDYRYSLASEDRGKSPAEIKEI